MYNEDKYRISLYFLSGTLDWPREVVSARARRVESRDHSRANPMVNVYCWHVIFFIFFFRTLMFVYFCKNYCIVKMNSHTRQINRFLRSIGPYDFDHICLEGRATSIHIDWSIACISKMFRLYSFVNILRICSKTEIIVIWLKVWNSVYEKENIRRASIYTAYWIFTGTKTSWENEVDELKLKLHSNEGM